MSALHHARSRRSAGLALALLLVPALAGCSGNLDPATVADLALRAGMTAHTAGRLGDAERHFREALVADPENVYAFYDLGVVASADDVVRAEYYYRLATALDPTYTPALMNLGKLLAEQGRTDEAIELYRKVTLFAPQLASAQYRLGVLLAAAGRVAESEAALTAAKTIDLTMDDTRADLVFGPTAEGSAIMASRGK